MDGVVSSSEGRSLAQQSIQHASPGPTKELLTPLELADRWGVTTGHLANLRHQGGGVGYLKLGSRVAYRTADVLAYEESVYVHAGTHMHAS